MRGTHRVRLWDVDGAEVPRGQWPRPRCPRGGWRPQAARTGGQRAQIHRKHQFSGGSEWQRIKKPFGELSCLERKALRGRKDQKRQAGNGLNRTTVNKAVTPV